MKCEWCGKIRKKFSDWEQQNMRTHSWNPLCPRCLHRRQKNPYNALLSMRRTKPQTIQVTSISERCKFGVCTNDQCREVAVWRAIINGKPSEMYWCDEHRIEPTHSLQRIEPQTIEASKQTGKYFIDKQWLTSRAKSEEGQEIGAGCDKPQTIEGAQMKEVLEIVAMIKELINGSQSLVIQMDNRLVLVNYSIRENTLHAALAAAIEAMKGNGE